MRLHRLLLLLLAFSFTAQQIAVCQNTGKTVRKHREVVEDPVYTQEVSRAESALEKRDFSSAEKDLLAATTKNPNNYRAWFDLGFLYNQTDRTPQAIDAYRKSVAANPQVFESTLNLGLLLARTTDPEAEKYLREATKLKPSAHPEEGWYRAWLSLGQVLQKSKPKDALEAFQNAAKLNPKEAEPYLSSGLLLEQQNQLAEAATEYKKAAELDPKTSEALAGLVNAYTKLNQLPEAEAALRKYIALDPNNGAAHVQLGRVLAAQKKYEEATTELETGLKAHPNDPAAEKEIASIYINQKQYPQAVPHIQAALELAPRDAQLHHWLGVVYLNEHKAAEAQNELLAAVKLKPDYGEAYGDLALAASSNKNYVLTLQALEARSKFLPEVPATYFLRATAFDSLKDFEHAADNYHRFLVVAQGRFPDEEWKARHRLIAIEPKK